MLELVTQGKVLWFTPEGEETVIVDEGSPEVDESGESGGSSDEPFLQVNDRTVYKSREDALKGFSEAQNRITSLSEYERVLQELGAPKGADAKYLKGLLEDYIAVKQAAEAAKKTAQSKPKTTSSEDDKEFEGVDPQIVAQTKRGREWLKTNAEKVGLVSKDKVEALEQQLAELRNGMTSREKAEVDAAISEGQTKLTQWLGDAKVEITSDEREDLEDLIVAYINSKGNLTQQWKNGDRAIRIDLIKSGYEKFLPVIKPGAAPFAKAAQTASAGKTKIGLMNRTRTLPQNGSGKVPLGADKKPLKIGDPALRDRAKQLLDKLAGGGSDD